MTLKDEKKLLYNVNEVSDDEISYVTEREFPNNLADNQLLKTPMTMFNWSVT